MIASDAAPSRIEPFLLEETAAKIVDRVAALSAATGSGCREARRDA